MNRKLCLLYRTLEIIGSPWIARGALLVVLVGTVFIDQVIYMDTNLFGLYFPCFVAIGLAFWRNWMLNILVASALFFLRYYINGEHVPRYPDGALDLDVIVLQFAIDLFAVIVVAILLRQIEKLKKLLLDTVIALGRSLDSSDPYTAKHSEDVAEYALIIAKSMKLSKAKCTAIKIGGLLHDIGKIGIPSNIINKKGRLTEEEFAKMKEHPVIGYNNLKHISELQQNGVLDIVLYHHERYDGKGYPRGLKGKDIPLLARIVCVADCFDAMVTKRIYRDQLSYDVAIQELRNNKGTQFDPEIVDIFLEEVESKNQIEFQRKGKLTER